MPKPNDLCECGHSYKQHRKGGACIIRANVTIEEVGDALNVVSDQCPCEKFTLAKKKGKA